MKALALLLPLLFPVQEKPPAHVTDINKDGRTDLILFKRGEVRLFINQGDEDYRDETGKRGLHMGEVLAIHDFDGDGYYDLLGKDASGRFILYRNDDEAERFEDVTEAAGLKNISGKLISFEDVTRDGLPDLLLQVGDQTFLMKREGEDLRFELANSFLQPETTTASQDEKRATFTPVGPIRTKGKSSASAPTGKAPATEPGSLTLSGSTTFLPVNQSYCTPMVQDLATGACLRASSAPQLGKLYPLSPYFNIDSTGRVCVGTATPTGARFYVENPNPGEIGGKFVNTDSSSSKVTLQALNSGSNASIFAQNTGSGRGIKSIINNPANTDHSIYAQTNGSGSAFFAWQVGSGPAMTLKLNNSSSTADALVINNTGSGRAASLDGALYVVDDDNATAPDIAEFFANNLNQGIGIGYNRISAIGNNANQDIRLKPKGTGTLYIDSDSVVAGTTTTDVLSITGGSDLAEPFEIAGEVQPGMVVCIDPENPEKLRLSDRAYDRTVLGVVSGAGGVKPGLTLTQTEVFDGQTPVALTGRVYVWCEAPVVPGDLLTTSATFGHAMAADPARAPGSVLGKALTPLDQGRGLVLMVVTLQ